MTVLQDWAADPHHSKWAVSRTERQRRSILIRSTPTFDRQRDMLVVESKLIIGAETNPGFEAVRRVIEVWEMCEAGRDGFRRLPDETLKLAIFIIREVMPNQLKLVPSVSATFDGDLHLDWSLPRAIVEVYIAADGERSVLIEDRDGTVIFDGDYVGDGERLVGKELRNAIADL